MLCKSPLQNYWKLYPSIETPHAASVGMSCDRFLSVLKMLHLNNNDAKAATGQPDYDPLFKIQPDTDALITKFQDHYTPHRTVDH